MADATANGPNGVPGRRKKKEIWFHVLRDDSIFQDLLGQWDVTDSVLLQEADWSSNENNNSNDNDNSNDSTPHANEYKPIEVESFRSLASSLPHAIKFTLELHIFNNIIIDIQQQLPPEEEGADDETIELLHAKRRLHIAKPARRMLLAFIQQVVPTLLRMKWDLDVDNLTLCELFARELNGALSNVKKAVAHGKKPILFDDTIVRSAMQEAYSKLVLIQNYVGTTESHLATSPTEKLHIDILRQRALWPYAEYSCRFFFGHLIPIELEIVNENNEVGTTPRNESRRGLREDPGWLIRDRFCQVTSVFDSGEGLVDWIADGPNLCGRRYELLFDKGVGSNIKIWLLSKHARGSSKRFPNLEVSRDSFLRGLGCFSNVNDSKLGDRIGLSFSQTMPIVMLEKHQIKPIPEISHNGYAFSDGCGKMGLNVAKKIREQWGTRIIPGAVQIRIGGIKGMLSLDTNFDDDSIGIRPSMIKFPSDHRVLEVKRVANGYVRDDSNTIFTDKIFNQALMVLHYLGVPARVFWDLQGIACAGFALEHDRENEFDLRESDKYLENFLCKGRKSSNERFSLKELEAIKESMIACKERVNLPAQVRVMFGIIDELGVLEEGEVLVGNGQITGDVLVFRSPCMFPGDVQRVRAVPSIPSSPYVFMENVLIFSSKGDRPLQDMLGGGDLDGDEYFVLFEPRIVDVIMPTVGHDFNTQSFKSKSHPPIFPPTPPVSPDVTKQLHVLERFIANGNAVGETAEAWIRLVDSNGVAHEESRRQAELHQKALDSRKHAFSMDLSTTHFINQTVPRPHYRSGKRDSGRRSYSLVGIQFERWEGFIKKISILIKKFKNHVVLDDEVSKIDDDIKIAFDEMSQMDEEAKRHIIDGQLHRYCVVCNNPRGKKRCEVCGDAWVCLGQCEINHWRFCYGIQWQSPDETDDDKDLKDLKDESLVLSRESETMSLTSFDDVSYGVSDLSLPYESQDDILESLIRIVFGHDPAPRVDSVPNINWAYINESDLLALRQCVLVEFYEGFKRDLQEKAKTKTVKYDMPHIFDVFTMEPRLDSDNVTLAVCMRNNEAGGLLMWRGKYDPDPRYPLTPPFHKHRVASLSGPCRVLENLAAIPSPDTLMGRALRRDCDSFTTAVEMSDVHIKCIPPNISALLNPCQKRAVATVLSSKYQHGFFLVQGPPGTGKTVTLAAMVASLKEGIVLASSNAAVANIAVKLLSVSGLSVHDVVVFGDNCDDCVKFLSPAHRSRRYRAFKKEYDENHGDSPKQETLTKAFISWLRLDVSSTMKDVIKHCPLVDDSKRGQHKLKDIIVKAKAVLCTLNTAGSSFLRRAVEDKFDTLFLDEAAQCTEAEFYIATNFPGIKRVILIGDPKQLNATVLNSELKDLGFGNSFMTNIMNFRQDVAHLLCIQYRCDPEIVRFSNQSYYENALLTSKLTCKRKPEICSPLLFINTGSGMISSNATFNPGKEERFGSSWRNPFEAQAVKRLLQHDQDVKKVLSQVENATTMVITPYRAQVSLISTILHQANLMANVKIDTVDSFQGQEADIVIFSAVRTEYEGFVNDEQRLNVALTRAKRVLRVVGDWSFWYSTATGSAMRKFVEYCNSCGLVRPDERLGKRAEAWLKPTWEGISKFTWRPQMVSRFHHSLKDLSNIDKNIAINTLLALCMPHEKSLSDSLLVNTKLPVWQQSALKGCESRVQIIWVAKDGDQSKPSIEAHFAGKAQDCNTFRQKNPLTPRGTVSVKQGLTGVNTNSLESNDVHEQSNNIDYSWTLNESLGNAILDGDISSLPDGYFDLDPAQSKICAHAPPLLIESGSGTGKTNVLFKHAVEYAYRVRYDQHPKSICFVTVSPKLEKELKKRYENGEAIERVSLPDLRFFCLRDLLDGLLRMIGSPMTMRSACTFLEHVNSRSAHSELPVDVCEAENEISGVILGSLESAKKFAPLLREEYIESKRSNIDATSQDGLAKRHLVYDAYLGYEKWKVNNGRRDKDDVVLELIQNMSRLLSRRNPVFDAVYLDEIQDFTYASIFLICSIAGRRDLHWVCAGDTAQMISPGCSFKFDGLKQTMLAVQPGIESKIKKVVKLTKNYRVTKDILNVANSILMEAKKCFKGSIEYSRPEIAVKDIGTRVLWCHWDEAMKESPRFGANQALIFTSTNDSDAIFDNMNKWLNSHPFILTTLDSKGLEFDDVVIAFDVDRKPWDIKATQESSLRLIRELYVAFTRAKRRVVVLIKSNVSTMKDFFLNLEDCNIIETDAKTAFLEFNSDTSPDEWFERGMSLFEDEEWKTAAGCFKAADRFPYFHWAQGRLELAKGHMEDGKESLRKAARTFFEEGDHQHTLELLASVMDMEWNSEDDYIYEQSKMKCPSFFTPEQVIKFALSRDKWNEITIDNLKSKSTSFLFLPHRENKQLIEKVAACTEDDRSSIECCLPLVVADYHLDRQEYSDAVRLYLDADVPDYLKAEMATNSIIQSSNSANKSQLLVEAANIWSDQKAGAPKASSNVSKDSDTFLLLQLFESPVAASKSPRTNIAFEKMGKDVIKTAFLKAEAPMELLHSFDSKAFSVEVRQALDAKYANKPIETVEWYLGRNDSMHAETVAMERIKEFDVDQMLSIVRRISLKGVPEEADRRGIKFQTEFIQGCLIGGENSKVELAISVTDKALSNHEKVQANYKALVDVWSPHEHHQGIKTKLGQRTRKGRPGKGITFLHLMFDSNETNAQTRKNCMQWYGPKVVEFVVSRKTSKNEVYAALSKFDQNAFNHLRPQPKPTPKKATNQKQTTASQQTSNNTRPTNSNSNTNPTNSNTKPTSSNMKPTNLSPSLKEGDLVLIQGIVSQPELNGKQGKIDKLPGKNGRYGVIVEGQTEVKSFKPQNLERFVPRSSPEPDSDGDSSRPSLVSRDRSASSSSSDSSEDNDSSTSEVSNSDSDGSIPPLTHRNDSSSDEDMPPTRRRYDSSDDEDENEKDMPHIDQRSVSSSSSNDSR